MAPFLSLLRRPVEARIVNDTTGRVAGWSPMTIKKERALKLEEDGRENSSLQEDTSGTPSTASPKSAVSEAESAPVEEQRTPSPLLGPDLPSLVPVALFLSFQEVSRLILARKAVLDALTAPAASPRKVPWSPKEENAEEENKAQEEGDRPSLRRRLVVPVVEVKLETTDILKRVSPMHVSILRIWSRAAVDEVKRILKEEGPRAWGGLEKFVARGCSVHRYDADALAQVFAGEKMRIVNLEKNQLRDEVVQALVKNGALARSRMDTLCIRFNLISDPGALAVAELLRTHETLETVNLKMNRVTDAGAAALAEVLKRNGRLRLLNLRRQTPGLTDKTARAMASALDSNHSLRKLRLRRNRITDEGAILLAQALERRFDRLRNRIGEEGALSFELDLEENRIGLKGGLGLLRCLRKIGRTADAEFCLFGNENLERGDLRSALLEAGEDPADADDPRLKIELSKPEGL